jgi:hypothetical protein
MSFGGAPIHHQPPKLESEVRRAEAELRISHQPVYDHEPRAPSRVQRIIAKLRQRDRPSSKTRRSG